MKGVMSLPIAGFLHSGQCEDGNSDSTIFSLTNYPARAQGPVRRDRGSGMLERTVYPQGCHLRDCGVLEHELNEQI